MSSSSSPSPNFCHQLVDDMISTASANFDKKVSERMERKESKENFGRNPAHVVRRIIDKFPKDEAKYNQASFQLAFAARMTSEMPLEYLPSMFWGQTGVFLENLFPETDTEWKREVYDIFTGVL